MLKIALGEKGILSGSHYDLAEPSIQTHSTIENETPDLAILQGLHSQPVTDQASNGGIDL
jgi:hypothetical protein